jgi:spermidine/putrescine-binding protein
MHSRLGTESRLSRRTVLRAAALGALSAIAAPFVRDSYAAGTLTLGTVDHWVPDANNALTALCNEWSAKNNVEVKIDYITSMGDKDKLTAAAEAQAGTGHDIIFHRDWMIRTHAPALEPLDGHRRGTHQPIRPNRSGFRISRQNQRLLARDSRYEGNSGEAVLLAP